MHEIVWFEWNKNISWAIAQQQIATTTTIFFYNWRYLGCDYVMGPRDIFSLAIHIWMICEWGAWNCRSKNWQPITFKSTCEWNSKHHQHSSRFSIFFRAAISVITIAVVIHVADSNSGCHNIYKWHRFRFCGSIANSKKLISLIAKNANAHTEKELMIAMHDDKKKQRK